MSYVPKPSERQWFEGFVKAALVCLPVDQYDVGRLIHEDEIAEDAVAIAQAVCARLSELYKEADQ